MPALNLTFPFGSGIPESNAILACYYGDGVAVDTSVLAQDILRAVPFFVSVPITVDGLAIENSGTGDTGEKIRMGLYASTSGGLPGALLSQTGEITLDNTRDVRVAALGAAQQLVPTQKYWVAEVSNATLNLLCQSSAAGLPVMTIMNQMGAVGWNAGLPFTGSGSYGLGCVAVAHTYGSLPSNFGAPTSLPIAAPIMGVQVQ